MADFRRDERIRRSSDFRRIYECGTRVSGRLATMFVMQNEFAVGRLGIAATRKLGGAVTRNRAKRLIRDIFRRNKIAAGFDVVVVPRRELLDANPKAIEAEYKRNLERSFRHRRQDG